MSDATPEPAQVYLQLRERVLNLNPGDLGFVASDQAPHVWGVVMETGYEVGSASLVCLVDGTTSLYYSTGGGMLGSGEYTPVALASMALVTQAEKNLQYLAAGKEHPLPAIGEVRFIFLTYTGKLSTTVPENSLAAGGHPLAKLYNQAQAALAQLRLLNERKR